MLGLNDIINLIAINFFGGSVTMATLCLLLVAWALCVAILVNIGAPPTYSVVPMIPLSIFFMAYGTLNETIAIVIILISSVLTASQFKSIAT